ncbi:hypothetical protein J2T55_001694 [Methylohalomonas lacus]|uniref:Uncharacterized protein n=1 Tax=Methylohalomonas lacus TaxID=398773 RepID=A0AAE3HL08_9GAMM|nr:hypothetical protein [Methylohalomonas lacus]MCS3903665.1 hypothetical protein [Methylohalomonas lacus]
MTISRDTRLVCGIILLTIPTIMYGGWTLLGILTEGSVGAAPASLTLNDTQRALWRAGHAHAGVWVILALLIQILLDPAQLQPRMKWLARVTAPLGAVAMPAGLFGLAFSPAFAGLIYLGVASLMVSALLTGLGLLRSCYAAADTTA